MKNISHNKAEEREVKNLNHKNKFTDKTKRRKYGKSKEFSHKNNDFDIGRKHYNSRRCFKNQFIYSVFNEIS